VTEKWLGDERRCGGTAEQDTTYGEPTSNAASEPQWGPQCGPWRHSDADVHGRRGALTEYAIDQVIDVVYPDGAAQRLGEVSAHLAFEAALDAAVEVFVERVLLGFRQNRDALAIEQRLHVQIHDAHAVSPSASA
jgi:hypothetical protein